MYFIFFYLLLATLPGQAAPSARTLTLSCESFGGKFSADIFQIITDDNRSIFEISISQKTSGAIVSTFPGARNDDGTFSFRNSGSYIPGFEQSFEIENVSGTTTGQWTRSQNLDPDQILSFKCH
jgi:hypothetical protein